MLVGAIETLQSPVFSRLVAAGAGRSVLLVTAERARAAGLAQQIGGAVALALPPDIELDALRSVAGVGSKLKAPELRLRIVDSSRIDPKSVMPPYHRVEGLNAVARELRGSPVLSSQQVEDVVAFLGTLK